MISFPNSVHLLYSDVPQATKVNCNVHTYFFSHYFHANPATIDDMEEGHAKSFPCGKSGIVKDSEKQADVVEGLPDTNLHPKPEETI